LKIAALEKRVADLESRLAAVIEATGKLTQPKDGAPGRDGTVTVVVKRLDGTTKRFEDLRGGTVEVGVEKFQTKGDRE
jgi:hypothetical protein